MRSKVTTDVTLTEGGNDRGERQTEQASPSKNLLTKSRGAGGRVALAAECPLLSQLTGRDKVKGGLKSSPKRQLLDGN